MEASPNPHCHLVKEPRGRLSELRREVRREQSRQNHELYALPRRNYTDSPIPL